MSSKVAAARLNKVLLFHLLSLIKTGKLAEISDGKRYYLTRHRYIGRIGSTYFLLPKGEMALREGEVWTLTIPVPKKWDKKWRLVLFDIPVDKRRRRDSFRVRLKEMGLELYQHSAWVHPYPLEDVVRKAAAFYKINAHICYVTADTLTDERRLLKQFKLTK